MNKALKYLVAIAPVRDVVIQRKLAAMATATKVNTHYFDMKSVAEDQLALAGQLSMHLCTQ